ncbi:MAG: lysylphosphatidylglycerol synthase transmembrane domain-containing protein [Acidobacteria bacterium]|nr:lysylphosphatidylglycerol synthase transmembrane domain-containing protein [Acidobacteriota bacterium]
MIERVPFGVDFHLDRKARITLAIAIVIAGVLLYFSLRGIDMAELGAKLGSAKLEPLAVSLLLSCLTLWLRSLRWRVLLNTSEVLPLSTVFWANALGYLGNNVLPARMGEFMRVEALKRRHDISRSYLLATALIERVMDAGVLVLFTSAALLTIPGLPDWLHSASKTFSILSGLGILTLFFLPHAQKQVEQLLTKIPKISGVASRFLDGLRCLHSWSRSLLFLLLTLTIWPIDSYIGVLVADSIGLELQFQTSMVVLAALGLSSAVPSTPGYVGVFQFVAVNVMRPFGIESAPAIAWILIYQAINYVTQTAFGLIGFGVLSKAHAQKS